MTKLTKKDVHLAIDLVKRGLESGDLPAQNFNMDFSTPRPSSTGGVADCGTALCIGGWAVLALSCAGFTDARGDRLSLYDLILVDSSLGELFYEYPQTDHGVDRRMISCLTPAEGIRAIERWQQGHSNPWES